jgi:hypothetical protein
MTEKMGIRGERSYYHNWNGSRRSAAVLPRVFTAAVPAGSHLKRRMESGWSRRLESVSQLCGRVYSRYHDATFTCLLELLWHGAVVGVIDPRWQARAWASSRRSDAPRNRACDQPCRRRRRAFTHSTSSSRGSEHRELTCRAQRRRHATPQPVVHAPRAVLHQLHLPALLLNACAGDQIRARRAGGARGVEVAPPRGTIRHIGPLALARGPQRGRAIYPAHDMQAIGA